MSDEQPCGILLVDDDPAVRRMLATALSANGFDVLDAADGRSGLDLLRRNRDRVSVVLADVSMPCMDGPQFASHVREEAPRLPVCLMTGNIPRYYDRALRAIGPVLRKPFRLAEAANLLHRLAGRSQAPASVPAAQESLDGLHCLSAGGAPAGGAVRRRPGDTMTGKMGDTMTGGIPME
jgi:CheY-like chemotaxis protein